MYETVDAINGSYEIEPDPYSRYLNVVLAQAL